LKGVGKFSPGVHSLRLLSGAVNGSEHLFLCRAGSGSSRAAAGGVYADQAD